MGIHNNFPTFGWIKLDGITVVHNGQTHIVTDFKTQFKYIYWSPDLPYQFTASNVSLNQSASRFLVAVNDKGNCIQVPNDSISVSYDGNSYEAISEKIYALYEKDNEFGDKFVAVEQDIDGIRTTVGTAQEDINKVTENISKIEQKAEEISLSVRELNQEYSEDKEIIALREKVVKAIINMNAGIGIFDSKITEAFKDRSISEDEEKEIQAQIEEINQRRDEVLHEVEIVIGILEGMEEPEKALQLASARDTFTRELENLISLINTAISDYIIVPTEITVISTAFAKVSNAIRILKNTLDEMILLGTGGTISEELARIGIKSNEIELSVSKTEETIKDESAQIRADLEKEMLELNESLNSLEDTMNTSFLDGILSESEKIAIRHNVETLLNEKEDVDKKYESIYSNELLMDDEEPNEQGKQNTPKTDLLDAYVNYLEKCASLLETINTILDIEGAVGAEEQAQMNVSMKSYREALGAFSVALNKAIDAISDARTQQIDNKYAEIIMSPEGGILQRVGAVETTTTNQGSRITKAESSITQLSNKITLSVTKDDLSGSSGAQLTINPDSIQMGFNEIAGSANVTISPYGLTVRNGYIKTSTLIPDADRRIVLDKRADRDSDYYVPNLNRNDCMSVDTNDEGIRLKHNRNTYVNVTSSTIDFYSSGYSTSGYSVGKVSGSQASFNVPMFLEGGKVLTSGDYSRDFYSKEHNGSGNPIYRIGYYYQGHVLGCQYIGNSPSGIRLKNNTNDYGGDAILDLRGSTGSVGSASDIYFKENIRFLPFENKEAKEKRYLTALKANTMESSKEDEIIKFNEDTYVNENFSLKELYNFIKDDMALCEYNYINEDTNSINIIAQDIADTKIGSLFTEKDENGKLIFFINHNYLAVIVGALQYEIQKREKLEGQVIQLEEENIQLKEQVESMEDRLANLEEKLEQLLQEK